MRRNAFTRSEMKDQTLGRSEMKDSIISSLDEDASDSDVSAYAPTGPTGRLPTPELPSTANPESQAGIVARLDLLGKIEKTNARKFELVLSKRQRKDAKIRRRRELQDQRIAAARARKDERIRSKRAPQDEDFERADKAVHDEESVSTAGLSPLDSANWPARLCGGS